MSHDISRRDFTKTAMLLAARQFGADELGKFFPAKAADTESSNANLSKKFPRYRAVSWWLVWDDLLWPNPQVMDKIRRRADQCAESGVNCCVIFGAHFRWDFLPIWDRLHDELHFIADELHQRNIVLFDHHSAVQTERPRNRAEALNLWAHNRHHVLFYPSLEEAARWEFNGTRLNDWRMLNVQTGQPAYLPAYNSEQFCMNNPDFRAAYVQYIEKLKKDVPLDGLMCDDAIYNARWIECGCKFCRARFKNEYGHDLPPTTDAGFWGNRNSEAFKDWIAMRFKSSGDFLGIVQKALPENFPLLACCSTSDAYFLPGCGMSYQDFIQHCNVIMLEMCGSTPTLGGTWDDRIPSQLLHLGIASTHQAPCFGLGYGFFPDTAFFVWALNKFLGSDTWFSTLAGRLKGTPAEIAALADDSELVGEGFRYEKANPQLFTGQTDTDVAVLFSRATRDYFGQIDADYCADYSASCLSLTRAGITCDVVTDVPQFGRTRCLVLSSAVCLSADEKVALGKFLNAGGKIIATGPHGFYDERSNPIAQTWLETFGIAADLNDPARPGGFPPYSNFKNVQIAQCRVPESTQQKFQDGWLKISVGQGELVWRPERITKKEIAAQTVKLLRERNQTTLQVAGLPDVWRLRQFRDGNRWLIHALPSHVDVGLHPTLKNNFIDERIVEKVKFTPLTGQITVTSSTPLSRVVLHSPDLAQSRAGDSNGAQKWSVDLNGVSRYFILEAMI